LADRIIIADSGPLIAFGRTKHLSLLADTLGEIIAPRQVLNECLSNTAMPGAREISRAIEKKIITPHDDPQNHQFQDLVDILGPGEAAAIILASQLKIGLLIDEKLGRQTAKKMNLNIIGTAGVLLLAKEKNLIKKIAPLIQELKNAGYYLSEDLIESVLKRADEKK
jgi:predicted nucleic acid-binding protein